MPMLKHFTGNCHIYIDESVDHETGYAKSVVSAKTSYYGAAVCNAVNTISFTRMSRLILLPKVCADLASKNVRSAPDDNAQKAIPTPNPNPKRLDDRIPDNPYWREDRELDRGCHRTHQADSATCLAAILQPTPRPDRPVRHRRRFRQRHGQRQHKIRRRRQIWAWQRKWHQH